MTTDQVINLLAAVTLIEMMVTIGLGVAFSDVLRVGKNLGLVARAVVANYILFPGAAVVLLALFHVNPMVAAGLLVAAVCPGAPYGPPFTALAKGNVTRAVGLMVVMAGSSAVVAPVLLGFLLPIVAGSTSLKLNLLKMLVNLLGAQLLPLCVGLWIRRFRPSFADRLTRPASILSLLLNLLTLTVIIVVQFQMLTQIRLKGFFGMACLLIASLAAGGVMGGAVGANAKSMVLSTSVRNVGVSLVIVATSFPGTPAITSATAYAIFQTVAIALIALAWGRLTPNLNLAEERAA